jgi:hypothetical protein
VIEAEITMLIFEISSSSTYADVSHLSYVRVEELRLAEALVAAVGPVEAVVVAAILEVGQGEREALVRVKVASILVAARHHAPANHSTVEHANRYGQSISHLNLDTKPT